MADSRPVSVNSLDGRRLFKFEKDRYTLVEILNKFSLPLVVLASEDGSLVPAKFPLSNVKARQPILLYKLQTAMGHYEAKPLMKKDGKLQEIGDTLKVPDNYDGVFTPLRDNGSLFTPIYYRIYSIAQCECTRFVICDEYGMDAYQVEEKCGRFSPIYLSKGTILRKIEISKLPENLTSPALGKKSVAYLKCEDSLNRKILLPCSLSGEFLPTTSLGKATLIRLQDIDMTKLPCNLKLVAGSKPDTPSLFDSLLRLTSHSMENHILAATISNIRNVFVELDLNLSIKFHVVTDHNMGDNPYYCAARLQCETEEREYAKTIKVLHIPNDEQINSFASIISPHLPSREHLLKSELERSFKGKFQFPRPTVRRRLNATSESMGPK